MVWIEIFMYYYGWLFVLNKWYNGDFLENWEVNMLGRDEFGMIEVLLLEVVVGMFVIYVVNV